MGVRITSFGLNGWHASGLQEDTTRGVLLQAQDVEGIANVSNPCIRTWCDRGNSSKTVVRVVCHFFARGSFFYIYCTGGVVNYFN